MKLKIAGVLILLLAVVAATWSARVPISRFFPIEHEGQVKRVNRFHKGGFSSSGEKTRQLAQFALVFEDGFMCECTDTSFAAVQVGDKIKIRGYHDVRGWPILDPEFWECDEAQLLQIE